MNMVTKAIKDALDNMDKNYCLLAGGRYQERPICYEFYHHLRKLIESGKIIFQGVVQAEPNKRYQHYTVLGRGGKQPDFIIHIPDDTENNLAIIEFKMANRIKDLKHDLEKLSNFGRGELTYKYLIEVVIGNKNSLAQAGEFIRSWHDSNTGEEIIIIEFNISSWKVANDYKIRYSLKYNNTPRSN
jgi:hypothetical protein